MVLLGALLVLLAAGAGVLLFIGTANISDPVQVSVLGGTVSFPPLVLLVTGMVVITLFWLGWVVLRTGLRRGHRRRVEARESAREAEATRAAEEQRLKDEYAARERQLLEERQRHEAEKAELERQVAQAPAVPHTTPAGEAQTTVQSGSPTTPPPPPPADPGTPRL